MGNVVVATTTRYATTDEVRAQCALKTFASLQAHSLRFVVVDGGSPSILIDRFSDFGAVVLKEDVGGMGVGRRQALRRAGELAGDYGVVVWMEPEKYTFVASIQSCAQPILDGQYDLIVPARDEELRRRFYPLEQFFAEGFGIEFSRILFGVRLDNWFGPSLMNKKCLDFFLRYDGRYGDLWDCLLVPRLEALAAGLKVGSVGVRYDHPPEQRTAEIDDPLRALKVWKQLTNAIPVVIGEALRQGRITQADLNKVGL